ncbi:MAG: sodium/proton-translocating pyrophosphatase, partial [Candidatus Liptonbacteria bacterium]|nr:sodium/proton-translocating pyrophosphatase [Candidatus Liptonbacteria bacterium]
MTITLSYIMGAGVIGILFALWARQKIARQPDGDEKMRSVAAAIREGSRAYLKRQYTYVAVVAAILAAILWFFFGFTLALGFLVGASASALAGYLGMMTSVLSNVRVAEAAKKGLAPAFKLAFLGGSVTGFLVVGLGLLVVAGFWFLTRDISALVGLGFGGSLISVFSRVGGGIYTKGADVGADLVGKVEAGIPEDDPRNPAVIADNVGDNVGDCAGMAADLFETYAVTLIGAMLLGSLAFPNTNGALLFPLALGAVALLGSLVGALAVSVKEGSKNIMGGLYKGLLVAGVLALILFVPITKAFVSLSSIPSNFFGDVIEPLMGDWVNMYLAAVIGLAITVLMVLFTDYYTSKKFRPVRSIAKASQSGHGTNVIAGLAIGMEATALPIIVIAAGMLASFWLFGIYGVAIASVSMLSLAGIIVAIDSFGPITDNAGGIAEMAGLEKSARAHTDALDSVGNTTKAVTKGYAIASAGLAALVLFGSFIAEIEKAGAKIVFEL